MLLRIELGEAFRGGESIRRGKGGGVEQLIVFLP